MKNQLQALSNFPKDIYFQRGWGHQLRMMTGILTANTNKLPGSPVPYPRVAAFNDSPAFEPGSKEATEIIDR